MKILFAGTRGEIDVRSRLHRRHSVLVVMHRGGRIAVDCGADWRGRIGSLEPDAIVLTHAHRDHAFGLADGAPCPVYASRGTWLHLEGFPIRMRREIEPGQRRIVRGVAFEAFPLEHSLRCPALGYRIRVARVAVFYAPDVAEILDPMTALSGTDLYIGDGASLARPIIRRQGRHRIGHASIRDQIAWCARAGIRRAIFTHCGTQIVAGNARNVAAKVRAWGTKLGVETAIARDGLILDLRRGPATLSVSMTSLAPPGRRHHRRSPKRLRRIS